MLHLAACEQSFLNHMPEMPSLSEFSKRTRFGTDPNPDESYFALSHPACGRKLARFLRKSKPFLLLCKISLNKTPAAVF
jgi:hypothetical protein